MQGFIHLFKDVERGRQKEILNFYDLLCNEFTEINQQEDSHELLVVLLDLFQEYSKRQGRPAKDLLSLLEKPTAEEKKEELKDSGLLSTGYSEANEKKPMFRMYSKHFGFID